MADQIRSIASAVIIPPEALKSPSSKRRQSSASDVASKRPRLLSHDGRSESPSTTRASPKSDTIEPELPVRGEPVKDRRKNSVVEERKRGQRLFGGLISTLSQSTPTGQQKRRLEIEKRQKEREAQRKIDEENKRAQKLKDLKSVRKIEQIKFDEQSMRIRHTNQLAMANFLVTRTEPKLYYRPWELLSEQENNIKQQVSDTEALIAQETQEWEKHHPKQSTGNEDTANKGAVESTKLVSEQTVGEPRAESPSFPITDTTNDSVPPQEIYQKLDEKTESEKDADENNGEVVVAEEDTVIY